NSGHVIIGKPAHIPSSNEFHPQCVKNPPTAGCDKINSCGAQPLITSPLPLTLSSNFSSEIHFSSSANLSPDLITQMKGRFDASKPNPSSISCADVERLRLPKQA
ncbi:hypothetical protein CIPAW_15G057400, partial [Carya illinoinensis]